MHVCTLTRVRLPHTLAKSFMPPGWQIVYQACQGNTTKALICPATGERKASSWRNTPSICLQYIVQKLDAWRLPQTGWLTPIFTFIYSTISPYKAVPKSRQVLASWNLVIVVNCDVSVPAPPRLVSGKVHSSPGRVVATLLHSTVEGRALKAKKRSKRQARINFFTYQPRWHRSQSIIVPDVKLRVYCGEVPRKAIQSKC